MSNRVEDLVEKLTLELLADTGIELVDVEYVKERDWYLRVFLDKAGGIEIEDCQWLSEQLEEKLDQLDPIKDSYYLEVSSPGLDRALKKEKDFLRHVGDMVEINTYAPIDGKRVIVGKLTGLVENSIQLEVDGLALAIPRDKAAQVRLHLDFK
ncbi:ribosome maturation factor RimP|uniref:Ribosome maturation factor RimP n=1 Tax=Dendrosporobacter quercicolus TaxID=146817 RepID=A0A1G9LJN1_9FIRM|nr:ribosome maturation factor RimP [Dendrosporobacter quercicolus]NSL46734.1 ribosome maturation factor RimP [Dendrosporobacter quercicolus DSM 1736]SDL62116.1 ribosome maturation factor RimP [Dendrosporobacter quercicolus]